MPFFIFKIFSLLTGMNRCYNSAMTVNPETPGQEPEETDDRPFFKKLRFWVHILTTCAFLVAGQYRSYLRKQAELDHPVARAPMPLDPSAGAPTVWSLEVQAKADHETLKAEIDDRKILSANVEEYRKENHEDLNALGAEVKGLRGDVQTLISELERRVPKSVSLNDSTKNANKE